MKIIIHAGWHKTGSSAIQCFLNENRIKLLHEAGILYPKTGQLNDAHHLVAWSLHDPLESVWAKRIGFSEVAEILLPRILQEAVEAGAKTCLLSSEEFSRWGNISTQRLAKIFSGHEVELVIYLRRQDRLAESFWAQGLKQGARMPDFQIFLEDIKKRVNFAAFCEWWASSFPSKPIVRIYNRSVFPNGDVIRDFADYLGLTLDDYWKFPPADVNSSISSHSARAIFEWNEANPAPDNESKKRGRVKLLQAIDRAQDEKKSQTVMRFSSRLKFLSFFDESNSRLFRDWCNLDVNAFSLSDHERQKLLQEEIEESEEERFDAVQIRLRVLNLRQEADEAPGGAQAADLFRNDGIKYLNCGLWYKAVHRLAAAHALRPNGMFIRLSLARALVELGRVNVAKGHLEVVSQGDNFSEKEPLLSELLSRCDHRCCE